MTRRIIVSLLLIAILSSPISALPTSSRKATIELVVSLVLEAIGIALVVSATFFVPRNELGELSVEGFAAFIAGGFLTVGSAWVGLSAVGDLEKSRRQLRR